MLALKQCWIPYHIMKIKIFNDRVDYVGGTAYYKRFRDIMINYGVATSISEANRVLSFFLRVDLHFAKITGLSLASLLRLLYCYLYGYTHIFGSNIFVPRLLREILAIRVIAWFPDFQMHDLPHMFTLQQISSRKKFEDLLLRSCDFVVVQNDVDKIRIRGIAGRARVLVLKFYHPVDEMVNGRPSGAGKDERYILLAAQGWRHKRIEQVVKAYAASSKRYALKIIGSLNDPRDIRYSEDLKNLVNQSGANYLGFVSEREKIELIQNASATLNYSMYEGWNSSVEEAVAYHIPVILSDIAIHREQVPGATFVASEEELASIFSGNLEFNTMLDFNQLNGLRKTSVHEFIKNIK